MKKVQTESGFDRYSARSGSFVLTTFKGASSSGYVPSRAITLAASEAGARAAGAAVLMMMNQPAAGVWCRWLVLLVGNRDRKVLCCKVLVDSPNSNATWTGPNCILGVCAPQLQLQLLARSPTDFKLRAPVAVPRCQAVSLSVR